MHSREKWVILERRTEQIKERKLCIFGAVEKSMTTGGSWWIVKYWIGSLLWFESEKFFTGSCFVPQQEAGVWDGTEPLGRGAHLEVGNWELTFESYSLALTQTLCISR